MKKYPKSFEKWYHKKYGLLCWALEEDRKYQKLSCFDAWEAATKKIHRRIKRTKKMIDKSYSPGNWQHEDIDYILEDIRKML